MVGPSAIFQVPGMLIDQGELVPLGANLSVVVVDLGEEVLFQMRQPQLEEAYPWTFDAEQPFAIPKPDELLRMSRDWVAAGGVGSIQVAYFTASELEQFPNVWVKNRVLGSSRSEINCGFKFTGE